MVSLVNPGVCCHTPRLGVDRRDRLLPEANSRLREVAVGVTNGFRCRPAEHHVEFRVTEDERVALVDQGHVDAVAERLRQHRCELETSEAGP